ncbi:MAG: Hsp20/alpha crystallin family protein, partial [Saprospiraceae bacterium]
PPFHPTINIFHPFVWAGTRPAPYTIHITKNMYHGNQSRAERGQWRGCGAWKQAAQQYGYGRQGMRWGASRVPVNVRETADFYEIFVFAPGLSKDAFTLSVSNDLLTIAALAGHDEGTERHKWLHQEYERHAFERPFQLNGKVDTDGITARYNDGVLEVMLPKIPGAPAQEIAVA